MKKTENLENSESSDQVVSFKVAILGDASVGKTAIAQRFCKDFYADTYKQTLGVDFFSRTIELPDNTDVEFSLFDIGGQELASKMLKTYIAGSDLLLFVYDLTSQESLENIQKWHDVALKHCKNTKCVLVGNKSDLTTERTIDGDRIKFIEKIAKPEKSFLVSARTGDRIHMLFVAIAGILLNRDLSQMMLDQRNIVNALVSDEKQQSAQRQNTEGAAVEQHLAIKKAPAKKKGFCSGE